MAKRRDLPIWIGIFLFLLFLELPGTHLFDPDEARYAEIPREMLATGDFVTPHLNGARYFEKPPLFYWLNAGSMALFGENAYAARLPVRLAAVGTVFLLIGFLAFSGAPAAGLWAALVYLSAPLPFALGRINITDGPLTLFLTLALFSLWEWLQAKTLKRRRQFEILAGLGMGLAVLTKGPIGIVLPGATLVVWALMLKRWKVLPQAVFSLMPLVCLGIAIPWFAAVEKANPGFLNFFLIHEHLQRFATDSAKRAEPFYFFFGVFLAGFLPWLGALWHAVSSFFKRAKPAAETDVDLFYIAWIAVTLLFFSMSRSKLIPYILPAFPAAAALAGRWLEREEKFRGALPRAAFSIPLLMAAVYIALIFYLPPLARTRSDFDLAQAAKASGAQQIACYKTYSQSFPWVLKRPVPVVDFQGELADDGVKSPDLFWSEDDFWKMWYSGEKMVVCLRRGEEEEFKAANSLEARVLARDHDCLVMVNFDSSK